MKSGPFATWKLLFSLGAFLLVTPSCKDDKADEKAPPTEQALRDAQGKASRAETSPVSSALVDAGPKERDWLCSVLAKVPRGGRFGPKAKKKSPEHAGIRTVVVRANPAGQLHLAVLSKDDSENDLGLSTSDISPARSVQAYRYQDQSWEDLGRPFQLIGWGATLEGVSSDGPVAYAVSTGIGDVRQALVASCQSGHWTKEARFLGRSFHAAALVTSQKPDAIGNLSILQGLYADLGKDCKPVGRFGGGKVPVWLQAPAGFAGADGRGKFALAEPDDCRLPRAMVADHQGDSIVVAYEQCEQRDGGDYLSLENCQLSVLWLKDGTWKRLPPFTKLGGDVTNTRSAVAMGTSGPLVAVYGRQGLAVHQAEAEGWSTLPKLPGANGCQEPIRLRADPARLVVRSCTGYGRVRAYRLEGDAWKVVGNALSLKPKFGAQERPVVAADWIGETPYLAIGYEGAPVARVFEGKGTSWQQILEAVVDPTRPKKNSHQAQE